ncbi:DUF4367 domain-containing protein [Candidatus Clostridium radicumherbarum]|uniref:DUF4367 domain-containing protein n=1 Tax=Candidatus Clostridium radicumherbarum TaxID=3381662 RepID=A0ABW8TU37_9CLOT
MKNFIISFICVAIIISVGVYTYDVKNIKASASLNSSSTKPNKELSSKQIPNPMKEYSTLDEARKAAGFNFVIPTVLPDGYQMNGIKVINGSMAEVTYKKGDLKIIYRTVAGNSDISGDYNAYDVVKTITAGNTKVVIKGKSDGINLATWTKEGVSFSLSFAEAVNEKAVSTMVESIK